MNVDQATAKLGHNPRNPVKNCKCNNCHPSREILEQKVLDLQHELAIWEDNFKAYPGAWCCERAKGTNGWHHDSDCASDPGCA